MDNIATRIGQIMKSRLSIIPPKTIRLILIIYNFFKLRLLVMQYYAIIHFLHGKAPPRRLGNLILMS